MTERVATAGAAAEAFRTLAEAEGDRAPTTALLCRSIAAEPALHELLLLAPPGQRLPVLVLASFHDVVLRRPDCELRPWYPSVSDAAPSTDDPTAALLSVLESDRDRIVRSITERQVQTNEVNRCIGWQVALATSAATGDPPTAELPLALVEVGASAGLNLRFDDYLMSFDGGARGDGVHEVGEIHVGRTGSTVRLSTEVRTGPWPECATPLPPVVWRVGLDQNPLDVTDTDDARWLAACTWPEQRVRAERLAAAVSRAELDPPEVVRGDLVDDLAPLLRRTPDGCHVVVLASWVLAYVRRSEREAFLELLRAESPGIERRGGRLSLLTLDAAHVLPWLDATLPTTDAPAELRHASVLASTTFGPEGVAARAIARCQAHLAWIERL